MSADAFAEAEALYARRAEGRSGGTADPRVADQALLAYRRAVTLDPASLVARSHLLRALFFRGGFCGASDDDQRPLFEEAKRAAEEGVRALEAGLPAHSGAQRIAALQRRPGAAELYFWAAVSWGQWALQHKLAAAWQGAAGRVRDLAEAAIALDPGLDQGSPFLILGRLHAEAPKLPLVTGWVSRRKGIESLRRAYQISPTNTPTEYFLAEALLELEPARKDEAIRLLNACAAAEPRPDFLVEDAHYAELARQRLAALR